MTSLGIQTPIPTPIPTPTPTHTSASTPADRKISEQLVEQFNDWQTAELRIDREARLVRNVALAGSESRNGYRYTADALQQAAPLYRERPVFLDHATAAGRPYERSTRDLVGMVVNPRFEAGRVRGDVQVLDTEAGRTFLALVEAAIPSVGMSHVVIAERDARRATVGRIHDVICVDAVAFPATAATFREQTLAPLRAHPLALAESSPLGPAHGETATGADTPDAVTSRTFSPGPAVFTPTVAVSPRDLARFQREAESTAALPSGNALPDQNALPTGTSAGSSARQMLAALSELTALLREWLPQIADRLDRSDISSTSPAVGGVGMIERHRGPEHDNFRPTDVRSPRMHLESAPRPTSRARGTLSSNSLSDDSVVARIRGQRAG